MLAYLDGGIKGWLSGAFSLFRQPLVRRQWNLWSNNFDEDGEYEMSVNVGTDRISYGQLRILSRVQYAPLSRYLERAFQSIVNNGEILMGNEQLHESWLDIFQQSREILQQRMSFEEFEKVDNFFEPITRYGVHDHPLTEINPHKEKIVFLLGAGASKPAPSNIPTVKELLSELIDRARRLDREQVTQLADYCEKNNITNIEDLLTAVQILEFCSRNPNILDLVQYQLFGNRTERDFQMSPVRNDVSSVAFLQDTLQVLFALLSNLMLPAKPNAGHNAIVKYLNKQTETTIITTNYDCCIDLALIEANVSCEYEIEFANNKTASTQSQRKTSLIKLHGSLNWFYCETCQAVWIIDIAKTVQAYLEKSGEYPIISVCSQCGGQRRVLLMPPHAIKFNVASPLQPLIAHAANYFENATLIVAVGFSFADADQYITRMISKALQASSNAKLIIIDPIIDVVSKVQEKFSSQIPNFDSQNRIIRLQGDCSELLPKFLKGGFFETLENNTESDLRVQESLSP